MKKLKSVGKLSLGLFIITILCSFGFKTKEHYTGKEYVEYWQSNPNLYESINQKESFDFKILEKHAIANDIILFGEYHGTKEAIKIDAQLIEYLNETVGMKTHLAEIDFSQAYFLNEYLREGQDSLINYVLNSWLIKHGHNNKDYNDKWKLIYSLNKNIIDKDSHIRVLGIDKIQDFKIVRHHLSKLFKKINIEHKIPIGEKNIIRWANEALPLIIEKITKEKHNQECIEDISFIQHNIDAYSKQSREEIMFDNFVDLYKRYNLEGEKIYGYFGGAHVLQNEINNKRYFGNHLVESNLPLNNKTYSITSRYVDSYMSAPSKYLPPLIKSKTEHTKMTVTCDNMALLYHYGINDLKSVTTENTNTFFDINAQNSPYKYSHRLIDNIGLYSIIAGMKVTDKEAVTTDYVQAVVLIRNSDWAEPKNNSK